MVSTLAQLGWEPHQWSWAFTDQDMLRGVITSVLVAMTCGVLGCFVVLRRMALIGDALSHAILPGVVIAFLVTGRTDIWGLLLGALFAGLTTAVLINLVSHHSRTKEDSAIGIVFTALFALGLILISNLPRGTHFDLKCFILGIPEAVYPADMYLMIAIAGIVMLLVALLYHPLKLISFDPIVAAAMGLPVVALHYLIMGLISATVVAGLKTTGVVLVVAMIITPASAAYQLSNRFSVMLLLAAVFGTLSAVGGFIVAYTINAPSAAAMVLVATAIFIVAMLASPKHGVIFRTVRRWRHRRHIETEDVIKAVHRLTGDDQPANADTVAHAARLTAQRVRDIARLLRRDGLIAPDGVSLTLTERGEWRALELVRAHRLWESYLADQANVDAADVHEQAEVLEHAHELAAEVADTLGHPTRDPHGTPIPPEARGG